MRKFVPWALLVLAIAVPAGGAAAQPLRGTGYFGGVSSTTAEVVSFNDEYKTRGFAFGIDWQIPLGESFSYNPFMRGDTGSVSGGSVDGWSAEHFLLGVDARWWPVEGYYTGLNVAFVDETLTQESGAVLYKNSGSGAGVGLSFGGEFEIGQSGNLIVQVRYLRAPGLAVFPNTDITLSAVRLEVGYRTLGFGMGRR